MSSASVISGERAWWAAGEDVEIDAEGDGEQPLSNALRQTGDRLGQIGPPGASVA